eukprot:CAMPEP_0168763418 /NCGR_PEP_ID=MMETSP0724-20121128/24354_1 /TAXON_ID=265536 /ORGANISM="Amphiprora sp., Strain CCMP467" /LENGTH=970 /DNA_ID=CAMNT_0008812623 /DNA_START=131 /DNA_END=3040 /DNA_ORIENTATION=+
MESHATGQVSEASSEGASLNEEDKLGGALVIPAVNISGGGSAMARCGANKEEMKMTSSHPPIVDLTMTSDESETESNGDGQSGCCEVTNVQHSALKHDNAQEEPRIRESSTPQHSDEPNSTTSASEATPQAEIKEAGLTFEAKGYHKIETRVYAHFPQAEPGRDHFYGNIIDITEKKVKGALKPYYHVLFDDGDERKLTPSEELVTPSEEPDLFKNKMHNPQMRAWRFSKRGNPERESAKSKKRKTTHNTRPKVSSKNSVSSAQSTGKAVGTRVWAKYTDGLFYWGDITAIHGEGLNQKCSIKFDDGDTCDGVSLFDGVYTSEEKKGLKDVEAETFAELESQRCRRCELCRAADCGHCESCSWNSESTSNSKRCCLFKICLKLGNGRARAIPGFPDGWRYYFDGQSSATSRKALHPALASLVVCSPRVKDINDNGRRFFSIEAAGKSLHLLDEGLDEVISFAEKELYTEMLGLRIRKKIQHPLVGHGWCRQWMVLGKPKVIYGVVTEAAEGRFLDDDQFENSFVFTVSFSEENRSLVPPFMGRSLLPATTEIGERVCQGGAMLYEEKCCINSLSWWFAKTKGTICPLRWVCPDHIEFAQLQPDRHVPRPGQTVLCRGYKIQLETRKSSIPGAGFGAWIMCSDPTPQKRTEFRLEAGELLDVGTYAPLQPADYKDEVVVLVKNFIFGWECETWSFGATSDTSSSRKGAASFNKVYDITSDSGKGKLHEFAKRNLLVYVNETDGKSTPHICAQTDPEGSIHYLLGHKYPADGALVFPVNKWYEVLIDYGSPYEDVRVRKGYSRLSGRMLKDREKKISENDLETLRDITNFSVDDVHTAICFIAKVEFDRSNFAEAIRTLIVSLCFYKRLMAVEQEFILFEPSGPNSFCDNGYTTIFANTLHLVKGQCGRLLDLECISADDLKKAIVESHASLFYVCQLVGSKGDREVREMPAGDLREAIIKAVGWDSTNQAW